MRLVVADLGSGGLANFDVVIVRENVGDWLPATMTGMTFGTLVAFSDDFRGIGTATSSLMELPHADFVDCDSGVALTIVREIIILATAGGTFGRLVGNFGADFSRVLGFS